MVLEEMNTSLGEVIPVNTDIVVLSILWGSVELDAGFCRACIQLHTRFAGTEEVLVNSYIVGRVA